MNQEYNLKLSDDDKRCLFAAAYLTGFATSFKNAAPNYDDVAAESFEMANTMLAESKRWEGQGNDHL